MNVLSKFRSEDFCLLTFSLIALISGHVCSTTVQAQPAGETIKVDVLGGGKLFADVVRWSEFEDHRTGTRADQATQLWLSERLRSAGYEIVRQEVPLPLFELDHHELLVDGEAMESFPIWTPASTGPSPVSGPLILLDENVSDLSDYRGKMVLVANDRLRMREFESAMRVVEAGAVGLVIVYPHAAGVLAAVNSPAPFHRRPLPVPVVLVGGDSLPRLQVAAANGASTSIRIEGRFNADGQSHNLLARLDRGKERWVVLSTPATGWFDCIGERATGVAVLLALAEWAASADATVNWLICITTGHELDHAGIEHLMKSDVLPDTESTVVFVSLGASVAARDWEPTESGWKPKSQLSRGLRLVSTPSLAGHVTGGFGNTLDLARVVDPEGGELEHVMKAGYPVIGMYGDHFWFHTVEDDLQTTDAALLESVARALALSLERILADEPLSR